jgi:thioredoxin reductase (NADPH)
MRSGMTVSQNENDEVLKTLVLGSGPAGLAAALYTARAELAPVVITGMEMGGQAALTNVIENYPGFPDGIGGAQLGDLFQKQAEKFGAQIRYETAVSVDLNAQPYQITTDSGSYKTQSLIIATGAASNHLNIPGEELLIGRGVSYCATCDGWFFKNKRVVVVGGGDSALEEAIFLTRFASTVTVIHRRNAFRAGSLLQKRLHENNKVQLVMDAVVTRIIGENAVKAVEVKHNATGEISQIETEGVFVFIGHTPNTTLFKGQLDLDERGYIKVEQDVQTSKRGVFAAGEVADPHYRQVITSAGMGAAAAIQVTQFLQGE